MATVRSGADCLAARRFSDLAGLRVGFVGNHTSRLVTGQPTHAALQQSSAVRLARLFSPEHGAFGREDRENLADDIDPITGLTIHSLYGATRKPTPQMLAGLDALVIELQDVGARFYTYASTMLLCLEAAHEAGLLLVVLDRPNPIGASVEGPIADGDRLSFTACHTLPIRHGLSLGEIACIAAQERGWSDSLLVIPCEAWKRTQWWDETGIEWISPSPAMQSLQTATVYPGICLLEQTNISVGRGTDAPFLTVGAPWINSDMLVAAIRPCLGPGIRASPRDFTPRSSVFAGEPCRGLAFEITDRNQMNSVGVGFALIAALRDTHGALFDLDGVDRLLANRSAMAMLRAGSTAAAIAETWAPDLADWQSRAAKHLLYEPEPHS